MHANRIIAYSKRLDWICSPKITVWKCIIEWTFSAVNLIYKKWQNTDFFVMAVAEEF